MAKMTKAEQLIRGLRASGYIEVRSASKRYRQFQRSDLNGNFMWVGPNGALRMGRTTTSAMSLSDSRRARDLMAAGTAS